MRAAPAGPRDTRAERERERERESAWAGRSGLHTPATPLIGAREACRPSMARPGCADTEIATSAQTEIPSPAASGVRVARPDRTETRGRRKGREV